jgi:hypothetical protein
MTEKGRLHPKTGVQRRYPEWVPIYLALIH